MKNQESGFVHSVSYGASEDRSDLWNKQMLIRINSELLKMATAGFSVILASGDSGPYSRISCKTYSASFPASSPYVTAVGATQLNSNDSETSTVWSGGGFSSTFPRQDY